MTRLHLRIRRWALPAVLATVAVSLWIATQWLLYRDTPPADNDQGRLAFVQPLSAIRPAPVPMVDVFRVDTCELRCQSDAAIILPHSERECHCDGATCDRERTDACCATYLDHCSSHPSASDGKRTSKPHRAPPPESRPFPPLHHGPELVFLDAVITFCGSAGSFMAHMSAKELIEWLEYMRFAGVGRFLLYDCSDPQDPNHTPVTEDVDLVPYVREGYVISVPWHRRDGDIDTVSARAAMYSDAHSRYGPAATVWRATFDPNEYPVVVGDDTAGFLTRRLAKLPPTTTMALVGVAVAGGQSTGQAHIEDRLALRYRIQTHTVVSGAERYFIRPTFATGYGKHQAGTSLSNVTMSTGDMYAVRFVGPLLERGTITHCPVGEGSSGCVSMTEVDRTRDPVGVSIKNLVELIETTPAVFPGIPSLLLRARLCEQWPFRDIYDRQSVHGDGSASAVAQLKWETLKISRRRETHLDNGGGENDIQDRPFDEMHAVEWPPRNWRV